MWKIIQKNWDKYNDQERDSFERTKENLLEAQRQLNQRRDRIVMMTVFKRQSLTKAKHKKGSQKLIMIKNLHPKKKRR
jgi:hypothetical protein